jgi:hypothetical protein
VSRYARRTDDNQGEVVKALRAAGVKVDPRLSRIGDGMLDLLCGYRGVFSVVEVKDGRKSPSERRLTEAEEKWIKEWAGFPVYVVKSGPEAVLKVTGKRIEAKP